MTDLTFLDSVALDTVTGGKTSSNEALTTQLSALQSSIKDLAKQPQQSAFGNPTNMMLFALLASRPSAPASTNIVYVRRGRW